MPAVRTAARSDPPRLSPASRWGGPRPAPVGSTAVSSLFAVPPWAEVWRRMPRLMAGLVLCGVTFACIVRSHLGLDPWDVLHQGISKHTGIPIGQVSVLVALAVLLGWIPLRQKVGLGTICTAVVIGLTMDQVLPR